VALAKIRKNKKTSSYLEVLLNKFGAEDGIRTRDPRLGKAMLYP
jgi:hypothetical protein